MAESEADDTSRADLAGAAPDEVLILRGSRVPGDPDLERHVRDAGFAARTATVDAPLPELTGRPLALLLLDLEPFAPELLDLGRRIVEAYGQLAPPTLAVMRSDDEVALDLAFAAGVRDVIDRPVSAPLLRRKVALNARRSRAVHPIGGYVVKRVLGHGGMGIVYEAERDGRRFALKVLPLGPSVEAETVVRFRREMEALRSLRGPGIPRFVEAGRTAEAFFYVMDFVEGETLHALVERGPVAETVIRRVGHDLANALHAMHAAGFVHRDVKPANVIVATGGGAVLIDYGLAKLVDDLAITRANEVFGTLVYMAPELLGGADASAVTDAYALGMTLLHAALGKCPMSGSAAHVAERILRGDLPDPKALLPGASGELADILEGLLRPDPGARLSLEEARRRFEPGAIRRPRTAFGITLRFLTGQRAGQALTFQAPRRIVIGRAVEVDVEVFDANVSRKHCSITLDGDRVTVKDLASANGTFVNGVRAPLAELRDGDHLRLADTEVRVEVLSDETTARVGAAALAAIAAPREWPPVVVPGYDIVRTVARAGGWAVHDGFGRKTREPVTVRVLEDGAAVPEPARARFLRDGPFAATLLHPNVVRTIERGQVGAALFLVTDAVRGTTLAERIRSGPATVEAALRIMHPLALGLELLRTCGVVHGGLEPSTIVLGEDGTPRVADLGTSPFALGLPRVASPYLAPEPVADHRSDVYGLAASVHHLIAGEPPAGEPLDRVRRDVPPIVARLVGRCLEPSPRARFQTAGEVARVLGNLLASGDERATAH